MDLLSLSQTLQRDAVAIVFVNVLLQQLGLPVPAVPTMLLAGSLAAAPGPVAKILAAAVVASVLADWVWYKAGKRYGYRVLAGLCKLSINPASCVSQTEARFLRWGMPSLVVAKFIPGFSTVAPPIAGAFRMHLGGFLLAAGAGGALWAGLALGAGWVEGHGPASDPDPRPAHGTGTRLGDAAGRRVAGLEAVAEAPVQPTERAAAHHAR